jgi:CBS domain-containing protein
MEKQFAKWIFQPGEKEVMYSTIFFDYRPVFGDTSLADKMTEGIYADIDKQKIFLSFLAKNAMQNPPPLSFFRNFIVERNGEHKDEFDIKARAMMPLVDAARVLILHARIGRVNNTFERFEKMAELEPQNSELFEQAADAYEILMRFRAMQGLKNKDSGRFFKPGDLNKMQRMMLRNSFQPIDELQKLLKRRFQLGLMG